LYVSAQIIQVFPFKVLTTTVSGNLHILLFHELIYVKLFSCIYTIFKFIFLFYILTIGSPYLLWQQRQKNSVQKNR